MKKAERHLSRRVWFSKHFNLHRVDGPAMEWDNGTKEWLHYGNNVMDEREGQRRRKLCRRGDWDGEFL